MRSHLTILPCISFVCWRMDGRKRIISRARRDLSYSMRQLVLNSCSFVYKRTRSARTPDLYYMQYAYHAPRPYTKSFGWLTDQICTSHYLVVSIGQRRAFCGTNFICHYQDVRESQRYKIDEKAKTIGIFVSSACRYAHRTVISYVADLCASETRRTYINLHLIRTHSFSVSHISRRLEDVIFELNITQW